MSTLRLVLFQEQELSTVMLVMARGTVTLKEDKVGLI